MTQPFRRAGLAVAVALLIMLVAGGVYMATSGESSTEVTVDNQNDAEYQINVMRSSKDDIMDVGFNVTTSNGTWRYAGFDDINTNPNYRDVKLVNSSESTNITISPRENLTMTLDNWQSGSTFYLVEGPEGEVVYVDGTYCDGTHNFYLQIKSDGEFMSSTSCNG